MSACSEHGVEPWNVRRREPVSASDWKHEIAPYLWGSSMQGTAGVGVLTAETDLSFSDILETWNSVYGYVPRFHGPLLHHGRRHLHGSRRD